MQDERRLNPRLLAVRALCIGLATFVVWAVFQLILMGSGNLAWHRNWMIFMATFIVCVAHFILESYNSIRVIASSPTMWAIFNIGILAIGAVVAFI